MAEIRVGTKAHRIDVKVTADQASYQVRGTAKVTISATLPDGKPAAGAEVALAVVDQALLELMPNTSWQLADAMLRRREWGVQTSTAQMEVIGRRHYGRKAVAAGGGGGRSQTRFAKARWSSIPARAAGPRTASSCSPPNRIAGSMSRARNRRSRRRGCADAFAHRILALLAGALF